MFSPKQTSSKIQQPQPNTKTNNVGYKPKPVTGQPQITKMSPTSKMMVSGMAKQVSPVGKPLDKTKVASMTNLPLNPTVKPTVDRVYSPNVFQEGLRKVPQPNGQQTNRPPPNSKVFSPQPTRTVAPRMSQQPIRDMNNRLRPNEMAVDTKKSMVQSKPTGQLPPQKRPPRMSEPVQSPLNNYNSQDSQFFQKEPSLISLPVVAQEVPNSRFMKSKNMESPTLKKQQSIKTETTQKTDSPLKLRTQSSEKTFIKKMQLTETVSTDTNSYNNSNRTLNSARNVTDRSNTPSPSKQALKNHKIQDFVIGKQLGSGKFGNVFVVKHKLTGFICALKIIPKEMVKEENIVNQLIRQLKIQSCLDHPNIIKLYSFFDDQKNVYLLLELGSSGQLYKVLKDKGRFSEDASSIIVKQICQAIRYLHTFRIIHRDIKPENIVVHQGIAKVCDFGWAVCRGLDLRSTFCGTPLYVSPEILKGEMYDERIDLWSIGILSYELLVGDIPFEITKEEQLIKIIKDDIVFPPEVKLSDQAKDFVLRILKKNPEDRLKIAQLLDHPFLSQKTQGDICGQLDF